MKGDKITKILKEVFGKGFDYIAFEKYDNKTKEFGDKVWNKAQKEMAQDILNKYFDENNSGNMEDLHCELTELLFIKK